MDYKIVLDSCGELTYKMKESRDLPYGGFEYAR